MIKSSSRTHIEDIQDWPISRTTAVKVLNSEEYINVNLRRSDPKTFALYFRSALRKTNRSIAQGSSWRYRSINLTEMIHFAVGLEHDLPIVCFPNKKTARRR